MDHGRVIRSLFFSIAVCVSILGLVGCSTGPLFCESQKPFMSMGSVFELQIKHVCSSPPTESLYLEIQNRLDRIESEMSLYQAESALSRFNRKGNVENVSDDFLAVLRLSIESQRKTQGAFDVSVWSALKAAKVKPLVGARLTNAKRLVDLSAIAVDGHSVRSKKKGVELTFDGVAKGYSVDKVAEHLEAIGYRDYLVNFSGNMRWRSRRLDGKTWSIALWDPVKREPIVLSPMESGAIASSGSEHNGRHIIDPRTLKFSVSYEAVSAIGPSAAVCDVLSTTLFVLSPSDGDRVLKEEYAEYKVWRLAPHQTTRQ